LCCFRRAVEPPEPVQLAAAERQEEAQVAHRLHQPPDLRAGEAVSVPKVPVAGRPRRDRRPTRPQQRAGHHVVPESARQTQARHGGAQEGRRVGQDPHGAQVVPRERAGPRPAQEEGGGVQERGRSRRRHGGSSRRLGREVSAAAAPLIYSRDC